MNFQEHLQTLPELQDFSVEIDLDSSETVRIDNVAGKQGSLRLLQAFLSGKGVSTEPFPLEDFCEYYDEWNANREGCHPTINALYNYNEEGGIIRKVTG